MPETHQNADVEPDLRPKALRYAAKVNAAEQMIVDALPDIIAKLVSMAREGDQAAARYLVDRIFGRVPHVPHVPAVDKTLPYTHHDWAEDTMRQKQRRETFWEPYLNPSPKSAGIPGISARGDILKGIADEYKRRTGNTPR